jgi:hypothetical protein
MQQQKVPIRHASENQADRTGVVDAVVIAQDAGQPSAPQNRKQTVG